MKKMLQEFFDLIENKPLDNLPTQDHIDWGENYNVQKDRLSNLFDQFLTNEELEYIRDTMDSAITSGEHYIEQINKAMRLQDAARNIMGDSAGVMGIMGEQIFKTPSATEAREMIEDMQSRLKILRNIHSKIVSILGISEIQSLFD